MVHFAICPHCQTMAFGTEDFHNTCWVCPHCSKWVEPDSKITTQRRMIQNLSSNPVDGHHRYE